MSMPSRPAHPSDPDQTEDWQRIAAILREEIARRRMSRQGLADAAKISISTLEKALAGKRSFTLATLVRLESVLRIALRTPASRTPAAPISATTATAPLDLGSYARPAVSWLEGRYRTVRPGFNQRDCVYAYMTTIHWDDDLACLVFAETERLDAGYAQEGRVAMPYLSSHIYLVTNDRGQFRTITLGRPSHDGVLHGILSTLFVGDGTQLVPMACPIVLQKLADADQPTLGLLAVGHPEHADARSLLDCTTKGGFAQFIL